jgi:hypothetical protein
MDWASFGLGFLAACGIGYLLRVGYCAGRTAERQALIDREMSEVEQEIESDQ